MMINFHKHKFRRGNTKPNPLEATTVVASTAVATAAWKFKNIPFRLFSKTTLSFLIGCFCSFSLFASEPSATKSMEWLANDDAACAGLLDKLVISIDDDLTTFCADPDFCNKLLVEVFDKDGLELVGATIIKEVRGPNAAFNVQAAPELSNSFGRCPSCLKLPNPGVDTIIIRAIDPSGSPTTVSYTHLTLPTIYPV